VYKRQVLTYLRLIIGEDSSPFAFSTIMAMTFTNKAAFEMKSRIISALDQIGNPQREYEEETKKALNYAENVAEKLNCKVDELAIEQSKH
jgi:ATP-dependent exoDNAse (exonuclease V) beta subunit